jgi:hypothetical protein
VKAENEPAAFCPSLRYIVNKRGAGRPTVAGQITTAVRLAPRRHFVVLAVDGGGHVEAK